MLIFILVFLLFLCVCFPISMRASRREGKDFVKVILGLQSVSLTGMEKFVFVVSIICFLVVLSGVYL